METLKILLCCGAGMSSGFLASSARKTAKKKKLNVTIEARSASEANELLSTIDVLLIGPHYAKEINKFQELANPHGLPAPKFWLNPEVKDFYDFTPDDVRLEDYETHPQIKNIPVAI